VRFQTERARARITPKHNKDGIFAMGLFTKDIKSMDDLFVHTLRDIYYTEKQIEQAKQPRVDC
jgi:hypothetical protein